MVLVRKSRTRGRATPQPPSQLSDERDPHSRSDRVPPSKNTRGTMARLLALLLSVACSSSSHYDVLGVPCDASDASIKAAYRKAALREHPDKQRSSSSARAAAAATRMERINEAYGCLIDPTRRRAYDATLLNPHRQQSSHGFNSGPYQPQREPQAYKVTLPCTLEQLGGYEPIEVDLREIFGLPTNLYVPPFRAFLPPGARSGERHRFPLPQMGAILVLTTTFEVLQFQQTLIEAASTRSRAGVEYAKALVGLKRAQGLVGEATAR